jgi:hypothetical protein
MTQSRAEHINYALQHRLGYITNEAYYKQLDAFVANNNRGKYMLVTGACGGGKSALLANWWQSRSRSSGRPIITHFVGSSTIASDFSSMILRLFREINNIVTTHNLAPLDLPLKERLQHEIPTFLNTASELVSHDLPSPSSFYSNLCYYL